MQPLGALDRSMAGDRVDMPSHPSYTGGTYSTGYRRETTMQRCTLGLLVTIALSICAVPLAAEAQTPAKNPTYRHHWRLA